MKKRRTWTAEQKLSILKEAEQHGVTATIRKHSLYANTYYQWKQNYECEGVEGYNPTLQMTIADLLGGHLCLISAVRMQKTHQCH